MNRTKITTKARKRTTVNHSLEKMIFSNGVTGKKCTAFFTARGVNNPYWARLGENQKGSVTS
jgi:hypothetical protein